MTNKKTVIPFEWEILEERGSGGETSESGSAKTKVYGGWIVLHFSRFRESIAECMVFIPDPNHEWEVGLKDE